MITLLIGKKGSGKTKKLIELANEAVQNSNGNVVVIEKGLKLYFTIFPTRHVLLTPTLTALRAWTHL